MAADQDQEFELVLGNKQLFGILFMVLVLLAVFFAMGYVMGRNTTAPEIAARPDAATTDPGAAVPAPRRSQLSGPPAQSATPEAGGAGPTEAPATPAQTTPAQTVPPQATPAKPEPTTTGGVTEPQPGETYWQVSAVARPEAELLVEVLSKKGFRTIMAPGPNDLFRVLVGPAKDPAELGRLRTGLEQAGFKPMVRKY